MDDEPESDDKQRVRILSTLESTRHASRPKRTKAGRRTRQSQSRSWLQGALWGVMGVGVVALMAGFVMVIQDSKPAVLLALPTPSPLARAPGALARQAAPAQAKVDTAPPTSTGPAVIETTHADRPPLAALSEPPAAAPTASSSSATPPAQQATAAPERLALVNDKPKADAAPTAKAALSGDTASPAPSIRAGKSGSTAAKGQDEDVALLEAMFEHTGRKPQPKPAKPKN